QNQDTRIEEQQRVAFLVFITMAREKERQRMVGSEPVFRRHWVMPPAIVPSTGTLLSRSKSDNQRPHLGEILISLGPGQRGQVEPMAPLASSYWNWSRKAPAGF